MRVRSHAGALIRLTEEHWDHINARHPELVGQRERVLEALAEPGLIQEGDGGELLSIRFYEQAPLFGKHLVGAYREIGEMDGFVLTACLTRRPSSAGTTRWTR